MIEFAVVVVIASLVVVLTSDVIAGLYVWRQRRRWRELLRAERTRSAFAMARSDLMRLAREAKVDPNSITFKTLYHLNTAVMRRQDHYKMLAPIFVHSLANSADLQDHRLREESERWSDEVRSVARRTMSGVHCLLLEYSAIVRWVYHLERLFGLASFVVAAWGMIERRNKAVAETRGLYQGLARLAT